MDVLYVLCQDSVYSAAVMMKQSCFQLDAWDWQRSAQGSDAADIRVQKEVVQQPIEQRIMLAVKRAVTGCESPYKLNPEH